MVESGIRRLQSLVDLTGAVPGEQAAGSAERSALLGSAYKRKAAVHAAAYLEPRGKLDDFKAMCTELEKSRREYETMASKLTDKIIRPYPTLNWLFLWSLTAQPQERQAYVLHAQRCAAAANAAFADDPEAYNSTMVPDAQLLIALLNDSLVDAAEGSAATLDALVAAYEEALATSFVTPKERDIVVKQIRKMALFHRAYEKHDKVSPPRSVGARIELLANRLNQVIPPEEEEAMRVDDISMEVATQVALPAPRKKRAAKKAKPVAKKATPSRKTARRKK
jgi:hypothetical protein